MRKSQRQPRKSHAQWQQILSDFNQTDLPANVYCKEHNLAYGTFAKWRQRLTRHEQATDRRSLVELIAPTSSSSKPEQWQVELELGNGMTLRLRTA